MAAKRNPLGIGSAELAPDYFPAFLFGGKAVFTVQKRDTQSRITFKVKKRENAGKTFHLVTANILGDGFDGYEFLGTIFDGGVEGKRPVFVWSRAKSRVPKDAPAVRTIEMIVKYFDDMQRFEKVAIYHEGRCARCGRELTVPESLNSGMGPECQRIMARAGVAAAGQTKARNPHYNKGSLVQTSMFDE